MNALAHVESPNIYGCCRWHPWVLLNQPRLLKLKKSNSCAERRCNTCNYELATHGLHAHLIMHVSQWYVRKARIATTRWLRCLTPMGLYQFIVVGVEQHICVCVVKQRHAHVHIATASLQLGSCTTYNACFKTCPVTIWLTREA